MKKYALFIICCLMLPWSMLAQDEAFTPFLYQGNYYLNAQFDQVPDPQFRASLPDITWLSYQGNNTYFCAIPENQLQAFTHRATRLNGFSAAEKWQGELPEILADNNSQTSLDVVLITASNLSVEDKLQALQPYKVTVLEPHLPFTEHHLTVQVRADRLRDLSTLPFIQAIETKVSAEDHQPINYEINNLNNTHYVKHGNLGYDGTGVVLGIGDNGYLQDHIDLDDRNIHNTATSIPTGPTSGHADHVAGIASGAGNLDPTKEGVAPGCDIITASFSNIIWSLTPFYNTYNMVVTNNSYHGAGQFSCSAILDYTSSSANIDQRCLDNPEVLNIYGAGNWGNQGPCGGFTPGYNTIPRNYQTAKNNISVGNVQKDLIIANASSKGPVSNGRIKPEISAIGYSVKSVGTNYNYVTMWGTSMASPVVAGIAVMLQEAHQDIHGTNAPSNLLKALLCNTAEDLGVEGPDYAHGFGFANAKKALTAMEDGRFQYGTINQSGTQSYNITNVPTNVLGIKVMLYWHDQPAASNASLDLVNDLDLKVIDANGNVQLPLVLNSNPTNVTDPAVPGTDHVNNIEQVVYATTSSNAYTIQVSGYSVPVANQEYVITYEYITDHLDLTYPVGKETFVPNELEEIRWEHDGSGSNTTFTVEFTDNGSNWVTLASNITGNSLTWPVFNQVTGAAQIRVTSSDGFTSTSDPFVIIEEPQNLVPNCGLMTWDPVPGAAGYEVYMLDGPYMESVATVTNPFYQITHDNGTSEDWLSVAPILPDNTIGRRAIAVPFEGLYCPPVTNAQVSFVYGFNGGVWAYFHWNANTGSNINGYTIHVSFNHTSCCGSDGDQQVDIYSSTTNSFFLPLTKEKCCFAYSITSSCDFDPACANPPSYSGCGSHCKGLGTPVDDTRFKQAEISPESTLLEEQIQVYPNPAQRAVNLQITGADDLQLTIEVFSADGKLLHQVDQKNYTSGDYPAIWNADGSAAEGIYIIAFKTANSVALKRVVIQP